MGIIAVPWWHSNLRTQAWVTAVAWVEPLAWELPYATGTGKKKKKHTDEQMEGGEMLG